MFIGFDLDSLYTKGPKTSSVFRRHCEAIWILQSFFFILCFLCLSRQTKMFQELFLSFCPFLIWYYSSDQRTVLRLGIPWFDEAVKSLLFLGPLLLFFSGNILLFGLTGFTLNKVLPFGVEKSGVGAEVASLPSNTAEVHLLTHSILFLCAYLKDYVFSSGWLYFLHFDSGQQFAGRIKL